MNSDPPLSLHGNLARGLSLINHFRFMGESVGTSLNPPQKFRFIMWVMLAGNVLEAPELESLEDMLGKNFAVLNSPFSIQEASQNDQKIQI